MVMVPETSALAMSTPCASAETSTLWVTAASCSLISGHRVSRAASTVMPRTSARTKPLADREIVVRRTHADKLIQALGGGLDGKQGAFAAGQLQIHLGARNGGAGSIRHGTRYASGNLGA